MNYDPSPMPLPGSQTLIGGRRIRRRGSRSAYQSQRQGQGQGQSYSQRQSQYGGTTSQPSQNISQGQAMGIRQQGGRMFGVRSRRKQRKGGKSRKHRRRSNRRR